MRFFNKLFRKLKRQKKSTSFEVDSRSLGEKSHTYVKKDDNFKVCIKTDLPLSREQKQIIFSTIKNGINRQEIPSKICINLMLGTGIMKPMTLKIAKEEAEVIF